MEVSVTLTIYEKDGRDVPINRDERVIVQSHRIRNGHDGMVLLLLEGKTYTVVGRQLRDAVDRCLGITK